jgi:hypothetical protein
VFRELKTFGFCDAGLRIDLKIMGWDQNEERTQKLIFPKVLEDYHIQSITVYS